MLKTCDRGGMVSVPLFLPPLFFTVKKSAPVKTNPSVMYSSDSNSQETQASSGESVDPNSSNIDSLFDDDMDSAMLMEISQEDISSKASSS